MARYDFTAQAIEDLREIARYTKKTWGLEQARKYREEIELVLQKLSLNPQVGRARDEVSTGIRSFRVASHIAFYIPKDDRLTVIRLLHPSQDIQLAFDQVSDSSEE
jgi:toxin ParE1/3/4